MTPTLICEGDEAGYNNKLQNRILGINLANRRTNCFNQNGTMRFVVALLCGFVCSHIYYTSVRKVTQDG